MQGECAHMHKGTKKFMALEAKSITVDKILIVDSFMNDELWFHLNDLMSFHTQIEIF